MEVMERISDIGLKTILWQGFLWLIIISLITSPILFYLI